MQFKHKLIYFCAGCAFVVIGQVLLGVLVPKVTAQGKKASAEFDTVTVRSLQVVDDSGKVRAQLEVTKRGNVIQVFNRDGIPVYQVSVDTNGAIVDMNDKNGKPRVKTSSFSGMYLLGGTDIISRDGGITLLGGTISITGGSIFMDDTKGIVLIKNGEMAVGISVSEHGGIARFCGNDGKHRAVIGVDKDGGMAGFYGNEGKPRAGIGVNEYGNGVVTTWDKHGYRQR